LQLHDFHHLIEDLNIAGRPGRCARRHGNIPAPAPGQQYRSVITAPVGVHCQKPAAFADMIEAMFPNVPKLELFAREVPGATKQNGPIEAAVFMLSAGHAWLRLLIEPSAPASQ
jgi:MT-A70